MAARTQTGRCSNSEARANTTTIRARLEVKEVNMDLQPLLSWTRDLDREADMGRQLRQEPTRLLSPMARHSWLAGTT